MQGLPEDDLDDMLQVLGGEGRRIVDFLAALSTLFYSQQLHPTLMQMMKKLSLQ